MYNSENSQNGRYSNISFFDRVAMFVHDFKTMKILDANEQAIQKYGYSRSELNSMTLFDLGKRVELSDLQISNLTVAEVYPREIWWHTSKNGEGWYVQLTSQKLRYKGRLVQVSMAHEIDKYVEEGAFNFKHLPRLDLMRTHMPFAIVEWDEDLNVRDFSEKSELLFDCFYEDVLGKSVDELPFLDEITALQFRNKLENQRGRKDGYFTIEADLTNAQNMHIHCIWHNALIKDDENNILGVYSLIDDITGKRSEADRLKKSEDKFRIISEQSFVGIYLLDGIRFDYVNPRLCDMTGYTEHELKESKTIADLVHPDDLRFINGQRKLLEKKGENSFEVGVRLLTKKGNVIHVKTYGSRISKVNRRKMLGVVVNQTEQVEALNNYRASMQSYQSLFDSITDSIYIQDKNGAFLEVNQGVIDMYGYTKEEIIGKDPSFLAAHGRIDLDDTMEKFKRALAGESQEFRWWGRRRNGEVFPKEVKLSKGRFFGKDVVIAVARDISETVAREEELRRNEELFEQLFSNSPLGVTLLNRNSEIIQVNNSFESLFGYTNSEISGKNIDELIVPKEDLDVARGLSDRTETFTLIKKRKTKSGKLIDVFIYGVPVQLEGETIAVFGIYMDITDRIEAEKQLMKSLEEKKILLAEIHHRVKNNLAVITGLLELQYHNLKSEEAKTALRDSQMRINSMGLIHEKLYQNENLSELDFGQYIGELVDVIVRSQNKLDRDVNVVMDTSPVNLPIKKSIPCGLVVNEIVTNSLKYAFPDDHPDPEIRIKLNSDNDRTTIEISDNGVGLPVPFEELITDSLGTLLIKTLTSQLDADLNVETGDDGTKFIISFSLKQD